MQEKIHEKVSVITLYTKENGINMPVKLRWHKKLFFLTKLGYHHKYREGKTLVHIFSVSNSDIAFRLEFNTDTLSWTLMEVSDGIAS